MVVLAGCGPGSVAVSGSSETAGSETAGSDTGDDQPSGPEQCWLRQVGSELGDAAHDLAVGANEVYVVGHVRDSFAEQPAYGLSDLFVARFDDDVGELAWVSQLGSTADDEAWGIVLDSSGMLHVVGYTNSALLGSEGMGSSDGYLLRVDQDGQIDPTIEQVASPERDRARAVTIDGAGRVYVVGDTRGDLHGETNAGDADIFIVCYDPDGTRVWTHLHGTSELDYGHGIATNSEGTIYYTGRTDEDGPDAFLAKLFPDGTRDWSRLIHTDELDTGYAVAVDSDDNVYVVGETRGAFEGETSMGGTDAFVVKYSVHGSRLWLEQFGTTDGDQALAVAIAPDTGVLVGGRMAGSFGLADDDAEWSDGFVTKFDAAGERSWTHGFVTPGVEFVNALDVGADGAIYVAGSTTDVLGTDGSAGGTDMFVAKLCPE
jgi:hypothetical protein